jgi:hypothetical protein
VKSRSKKRQKATICLSTTGPSSLAPPTPTNPDKRRPSTTKQLVDGSKKMAINKENKKPQIKCVNK